jgi:predicted ATPase with chaperone activity
MFGGLMGQLFGGGRQNINPNKEKVRNKFINHVAKYQNKEMDFFKDECERFNYVATNLIKKISKIYSLIPDEKEQTNESILNWDLHQKLMEKKYGKRKIDTKYKF